MPGLQDLLNMLKSHHIKTAIASSSPHNHIELILNRLNVRHYFDKIISGDDVKHGKPAPDIFLKAAELLGLNPKDCMVIEDAPTGVTASNRAEITVIAVPNEFTRKHSFDNADLIVNSLSDISWDKLVNLTI